MPRVVPSQIVAFIDTIPLPPTEGFTINDPGVDTSEISGLADLLDQIPEGETLAKWAARPTHVPDGHILYSVEADAIRGIRSLLSKCPDESPAAATSELKFITDPDFRTNLRNDIGGVNRALSNGEWKPATVLAGSAIEALLLWSLSQRKTADIAKAIVALTNSGELTSKPDATKLERWDLHEFTEVAANLGIIKPDTATETRLARGFRNLIHPGRAQRLGQKCDRGSALSSVAALDHVVRDLTP